jgi:hypothetical protein
VYQLAPNAKDGVEHLVSRGLDFTIEQIGKLLAEITEDSSLEHGPLGSLLLEALPSRERVLIAASKIPGWELGQFLVHESTELNRVVASYGGVMHGDFHLRNILFAPSPVIIDFALSRPGLLAYDLARVIADLILFDSDSLSRISRVDDGDPVLDEIFGKFFKQLPNFLAADSKCLLRLFLQLCLAQVFTYTTISATSRKRLKEVLQNSPTR